ncbi:MAG: hypothetical protein ACR2P3_12545, partial [Geminicoccaceae bacterium]
SAASFSLSTTPLSSLPMNPSSGLALDHHNGVVRHPKWAKSSYLYDHIIPFMRSLSIWLGINALCSLPNESSDVVVPLAVAQ